MTPKRVNRSVYDYFLKEESTQLGNVDQCVNSNSSKEINLSIEVILLAVESVILEERLQRKANNLALEHRADPWEFEKPWAEAGKRQGRWWASFCHRCPCGSSVRSPVGSFWVEVLLGQDFLPVTVCDPRLPNGRLLRWEHGIRCQRGCGTIGTTLIVVAASCTGKIYNRNECSDKLTLQ